MSEKNWQELIYAYALKNAIAYNGKANISSVLSSLFNEGLKKEEVKSIIPKISKIIKEISKLKELMQHILIQQRKNLEG